MRQMFSKILEVTTKLFLLAANGRCIIEWYLDKIHYGWVISVMVLSLMVLLYKPWLSRSQKKAIRLNDILSQEGIHLPAFLVLSKKHSSTSQSFMGHGNDSWTDTYSIKSLEKNGFANIRRRYSISRGQSYAEDNPSHILVTVIDDNTAKVYVEYDIMQ